MYNKFKSTIIQVILFVIIVFLGHFINENVRKITAKIYNYEATFANYSLRYNFYNNEVNDKFLVVRNKYIENGDFSNSFKYDKKWLELVKYDNKSYAMIELSGYFFTTIISIVGILLYKSKRNYNYNLNYKEWIYIFLSLFFMRNIFIFIFDLIIQSRLCNENKFWEYFGFHWFYITSIPILLGMLWLLIIIFKFIPKIERFIFILVSFIGLIISYELISKFMKFIL